MQRSALRQARRHTPLGHLVCRVRKHGSTTPSLQDRVLQEEGKEELTSIPVLLIQIPQSLVVRVRHIDVLISPGNRNHARAVIQQVRHLRVSCRKESAQHQALVHQLAEQNSAPSQRNGRHTVVHILPRNHRRRRRHGHNERIHHLPILPTSSIPIVAISGTEVSPLDGKVVVVD